MKEIIEYLLTTTNRCKLTLPTRRDPIYIKLKQKNQVEAEDDRIHYWFVDEPRPGSYNLVLSSKKSLESSWAVLSLLREGVFRGREASSSGYCVLVPEDSRKGVWQNLQSKEAYDIFVSKRVSEGSEISAYVPQKKSSTPEKHPFLNSSNSGWQDQAFLLKDLPNTENIDSDTAIGIAACDRFHYFRRAVSSIAEANRGFNFPAFLFLDLSSTKPTADSYKVMEQQIEFFRSAFPSNSWIIPRKRNFGCGRNIIELRWQLFNHGFENVYVFEDDMEVSPDYIQWCENMASWAGKKRLKIGAVQAWSKCLLLPEEKGPHLNKVYKTHTNWWGYRMRKSAWQAIEPTLLEYLEKLPDAYEKRNHSAIREWFKEILSDYTNTERKDPAGAFQRYADLPPTGQDAVTMIAFQKAGFSRLASVVNRGKYIGKSGIHSNPTWYNRDLFHLVSLDPVKKVPSEFTLVKDLPTSIRFNQKEAAYVRSLAWS